MKLSEFDYVLPKERIAQVPLKRRDDSRLLVLHRDGERIEHRTFQDLLDYLHPKDALVLNDTRVKPARVFGERPTGAKVEALFLRKATSKSYKVLLNSSSKLKVGDRILFGRGFEAELVTDDGIVKTIRFEKDHIENWIRRKGLVPLPPYIRRAPEAKDVNRYQTVYAKKEGAVAAPTAGLHFTKTLLQKISQKGIQKCTLTLHVGYGTFEPVREEEITRHKMHEEYFEIPRKTCDALNETRRKGGRIVAVGTTSCRVLETSVRPHPLALAARSPTPAWLAHSGLGPSLVPEFERGDTLPARGLEGCSDKGVRPSTHPPRVREVSNVM